MQKIVKATNGKKTESAGILMVAFQILILYKPDLINPTAERTINMIISSGVIGALAHRIYRSREKIWYYIKNKLKGLKTA